MPETSAKIRVQFDFAPEAYDELTDLQDKLRAPTKAEVVRYAIRTLQWVVENMEERVRILVDDGECEREVVFPFLVPASSQAAKRPIQPRRETTTVR